MSTRVDNNAEACPTRSDRSRRRCAVLAHVATAGENRRGGALFALEHPRPAFESLAFLAGDLGDRALRSHVPIENNKMAFLLDGT